MAGQQKEKSEAQGLDVPMKKLKDEKPNRKRAKQSKDDEHSKRLKFSSPKVITRVAVKKSLFSKKDKKSAIPCNQNANASLAKTKANNFISGIMKTVQCKKGRVNNPCPKIEIKNKGP